MGGGTGCPVAPGCSYVRYRARGRAWSPRDLGHRPTGGGRGAPPAARWRSNGVGRGRGARERWEGGGIRCAGNSHRGGPTARCAMGVGGGGTGCAGEAQTSGRGGLDNAMAGEAEVRAARCKAPRRGVRQRARGPTASSSRCLLKAGNLLLCSRRQAVWLHSPSGHAPRWTVASNCTISITQLLKENEYY